MEISKVKTLPSQEYLKECFDYDYETGLFTWRMRPEYHFKESERFSSSHSMNLFNSLWAGKVAGRYDNTGYKSVKITSISYRYHRLVWKYCTGLEPVAQIDHINSIKDDNRFENLRDVSISDNQHNKGLYKHNESGTKGVHYDKKGKTWKAGLNIRGNHIHLGFFKDKENAIKARKEAELKDWSHLEDIVRIKEKKHLTLQFLKECFYYEDGVLYWKERPLEHFKNEHACNSWNTHFSNTVAGTKHKAYQYVHLNNNTLSIHRAIYQLCHNLEELPRNMVVDHIDGQSHNNHIENLRLLTRSENSKNTPTTRKQAEELYHGEFARK